MKISKWNRSIRKYEIRIDISDRNKKEIESIFNIIFQWEGYPTRIKYSNFFLSRVSMIYDSSYMFRLHSFRWRHYDSCLLLVQFHIVIVVVVVALVMIVVQNLYQKINGADSNNTLYYQPTTTIKTVKKDPWSTNHCVC